MTTNNKIHQDLSIKVERDLILVNILSALFISMISFFPDSPARIILGLPFIFFFPGYVLISALFPRKTDLDFIERLTLSFGLSIAVTSVIGLVLNFTPFGIRLYSTITSLFLFIFLMSLLTMLKRRSVPQQDVFAPLTRISISTGFEDAKKIFDESSRESRVIKILAIIAFIFILLALMVISITPPATGYEISIYDAYPPYFWLLLIAAIACGIIIMVRNAFSEKPSPLWSLGFIVILLTNLVILLLPIFRGYITFGRWDVLSHIGFTRDIIFTGHFPLAGEIGANHYPVIHILLATLSEVTGLTPELLVMIVPVFFTLFYMVSVYLLAKVIAPNPGQVMLITAFGSLLLFIHESSMLASSIQCFFMLPLTFFLYFKVRTRASGSLAYSILFVLMLLLTPFFHPGEGTLFLIPMFLCVELSTLIYRAVNKSLHKNPVKTPQLLSGISINPILILFCTWFTWFASFAIFGGVVREIWNWLIYEIGRPTAMLYEDIIRRVGLSIYEFMELFFKMWGHVVIYGLVGVLVSIVIWKRFLSRKGSIELQQVISSSLFILFAALIFVTFFGDVWLGYGRAMRYVIFTATVLNGLGLYTLFQNRYKQIGVFVIILLLIVTASVGVFNTFSSPITRNPNFQVTRMEMEGMSHFFTYRDDSLLIYELGVGQSRFADAIYGRMGHLPNIRYQASPPDHFGYLENETFGESLIEDSYLIMSKLGRIASPEIFPEFRHLWKFTPEDFYRLDNEDPSVNKIYTNGEFWVYHVQGVGTLSP